MEPAMHRTQIYLPDALYETLKIRSRSVGVSISELIRRALESELQKDPVADARAFFEQLKPLESFANIDAESYVRSIRGKSRILQTGDET
jgi:negative regulator of replication initiation